MATSRQDARRIRKAGLRLGSPDQLTVLRRRCGRGFTYLDKDGERVSNVDFLCRARSLAIPPAYTDVYIAPSPDLHLQAIGRDDAGRLQYLYHAAWVAVREARKTDRLGALCQALPKTRDRFARILRQSGQGRDKALAAAITLIDRTHIRVGCDEYVHSGRSRGAATLLKRNVRCEDGHIHLSFYGKRRQPVRCSLYAPALARTLEELREIPGQRLLQYRDDDGGHHPISAGDINDTLREITGAPVTAKDFRTLAATAAAGELLSAIVPAPTTRKRQQQITEAMRSIALLLSNTPAVVRKSYVHDRLIETFENGKLQDVAATAAEQRKLSRGEAVVAALFLGGADTA